MAPVAIDNVACNLSEAGATDQNTNTRKPKTLPAQWMRDENIFQLEKRAIFSKV